MSASFRLFTPRLLMVVPAAAAILALSGQVHAADRGRGHDRGGGDHTSRGLSVGFGISSHGSGVSFGFSDRGGCRPSPVYCPPVRSYCPPVRTYCPPPVYVRPYCPPPRVIVNRYDNCSSGYGVYVGSPVVVERPVQVVEREVVVQAPPVVVEKPVYVQQPVVTQAVFSAEVRPAAPAQAAEQPSYRDRELGDAYLRMGDPDNAVRVYSKYLTAWNADGTAVRNLGFAQIARGDAQEGARSVVRGYQLEPTMLTRPLAPNDLGGNVIFQRMLDNATRAAAGNNTADAWLAVAILQHVAGQREQSVNALQRSRDAGLDKALLDQFTLELSK